VLGIANYFSALQRYLCGRVATSATAGELGEFEGFRKTVGL